MIIIRIETCLWVKPTGEEVSHAEWDKVPIEIVHRAYTQESPLDIGNCLEETK